MKNLTPSTLDPFNVFIDIASAKNLERRSRLLSLSAAIRNHYDEYSNHSTQLSKITSQGYKDTDKEDLEHCYTSSTRPLDQLLASIKMAQPQGIRHKCQYCGIDSPTTFDHYLPRSIFPEFAVYSLNILPCCVTCNLKKSIIFIADNERQILNLYFDSLPSSQYLNVKINYNKGVPVAIYYLTQTSDMSDDIFRLINTHYSRLELLNRFQENSPEIFSEKRSFIKTHMQAASDELIKKFLIDEANRLEKKISKNYWETVLLLEMANDPQFLSSC